MYNRLLKATPKADRCLQRQSYNLWGQHFYYTRGVITSILSGLPDLNDLYERLMSNQDDLGNMIRPYFPADQVDRFVELLKEHITIAGNIAALIRDNADTQDTVDSWYKNAEQIITVMEEMNAVEWRRSITEPMFNRHLTTTLTEMQSRKQQNWNNDFAAADVGFNCILDIADIYANGIV